MYYFYYGIWYSIKSRLSPKTVLILELSLLVLVALFGLGIIGFGITLLGGF